MFFPSLFQQISLSLNLANFLVPPCGGFSFFSFLGFSFLGFASPEGPEAAEPEAAAGAAEAPAAAASSTASAATASAVSSYEISFFSIFAREFEDTVSSRLMVATCGRTRRGRKREGRRDARGATMTDQMGSIDRCSIVGDISLLLLRLFPLASGRQRALARSPLRT